MRTSPTAAQVSVPGFVDHHAHLLRAAAGLGFPATPQAVGEFHREVQQQGGSPMDVLDPPGPLRAPDLGARLIAGLNRAAATGLVEITEMGLRSWAYLDALMAQQAGGPLPCRVRIYVASGLADESGPAGLDARRADCGPWVRLEGIKFYADGWLVPRTCALSQDFADAAGNGVLFADAPTLARRIQPFAERGWRIATHAIGDRAVAAVLDAYDIAFGGDAAEMAQAAPRIEHASVLSAELMTRMADTGVVACIQPSFAVSDADELSPALGAARARLAYPWTELARRGVALLAGTDFPIEVLDPLPSLARLVNGQSGRSGFTSGAGPEQARLAVSFAFALMSDPAAGQTLLSEDPRAVPASELDTIAVLGTVPASF
jgi:predicted amidohydrolase YtcJ